MNKKNNIKLLLSTIGCCLFVVLSLMPSQLEAYFIISVKRYHSVKLNVNAGFLPENIYDINLISVQGQINPLDNDKNFFQIKRDELFHIRFIERFIDGNLRWRLEWDENKQCRRYIEVIEGAVTQRGVNAISDNAISRELVFDQTGHLLHEKWLDEGKITMYRYFYHKGKIVKTQYLLDNLVIREDRHLYNKQGDYYRDNLFDDKGNFLGYNIWTDKNLSTFQPFLSNQSNSNAPIVGVPKSNYFIVERTIGNYNVGGKLLGEKILTYSNVMTTNTSTNIENVIESRRYLQSKQLLQEEENELVTTYIYNDKGQLIESKLIYKPTAEQHNQVRYSHRNNQQKYSHPTLFEQEDSLADVFYAHYYFKGKEYKNLKERIIIFDNNKRPLSTIEVEKEGNFLTRVIHKYQNEYKTFSSYQLENNIYKLKTKKLQTAYSQLQLARYEYWYDGLGRLTREDFKNKDGNSTQQILYFYGNMIKTPQSKTKNNDSNASNSVVFDDGPFREVNEHINNVVNENFFFMGRSFIDFFLYKRRENKSKVTSHYHKQQAQKLAERTRKIIENGLAKIVFLDENKDIQSYIRIYSSGFAEGEKNGTKKELTFRYYSKPIQFGYTQNPDSAYYNRLPFINAEPKQGERISVNADGIPTERDFNLSEKDFLENPFDGVDKLKFKRVEFLEEELIFDYRGDTYLPFRGNWIKYNIDNNQVVEWVKLDPNDVYLLELREPSFLLSY